MSYIEKMTIQGIRSFGVSEQDRGMIMFFSPLTLILGPNGTGKTTIIECLKYMTTGNLPPGGKQDAAFIHDPKIARESEVKAQIRLLFRDVRGQKCMAIRSLIATQKKNKIEFKTLDSTITRQLANGEKQSISSKCAEMDSEMVSLLGVSKAILDNVIFCHQEDSTWPLSEGKALKQKFDDIFASTRYVKALDAIRKLRQDQGILIREYQIDIKHLKQYKEKAAQIASDLAEREERLKNAEDIVKKAEEKLMPVKAKLDQLIMKEGDMHKIKALIEKYKGEKMQVEKAQRDLRQNIHDEFRGSMEELKQELAAFENKVIEMERTLKQNQEKLNNLEKDLMNQSDERSKLLTEQGRLEQEAERHKQTKKNRDEEVQKLAQRYQLPGFSGSQVTDQLTQTLLTSLESRAKQLLDEAKAQRLEYEKKEADLQLEIDKVKNRKTKLETEQSMKQEKLRENRKEIQNINNELCRVDASANRLQDVDKEIRNAELMLEEAERSVDVETLRSELLQLQKDKSAMDNTMKTLDGELTRLTQESSIRAQLDVYSRDRTSKEDQIKRLKAKNEDTLQHILGSVPSDGVGKALDKFLREHSRQLRTDTEQLQLLQKQLVEKTTKRNMQQDILGRKREELRNVETRITNATKGQEFDACISELQTNLQKNQDTKGYMAAVDCLYKKYIAKLRAHDPACPLCHRVFEEQSEVEELINEMEQKLNMVPEKLERVSSSIADTKADYERLLQLKPVYDSIKQLKEKEIPDLESDLQTLNSDIQRLSNEISEKEELVDVNKNDETVAKNMMSDATQIDRLQTELQDLIRKIDSQTARLAPGSTTRCLSEVQNQRSELQLEQELVNQKIDRKRQKLTDHTERVQQLKGSVTELRSERLQIETDLQKRTRLEENKEELTNANEILDREIREALEQVRPLQDRVDDLSEKKDQCSRTKEEKFEEGKEKCSKVRDHCQLIERFQMEIDKYVKDGRSDRLSVCRAKMSEMEQKRQQLESQKSTLAGAINAGQQDLARQKIHQRDLADNMQLRKLQAEVEEIVNKIKEEEVRLGGIDIDNLVRERNSLEKECKKLSDEKEAAKSRQLSLKGEISAFRRDLESDMYKDADKKYRDKLIELRTTELANVDLEKYYKALDATIMAYHNQKMAEINKIIQDLWRNTYRGNDIETIEIRSEEDEGSGAAKTRRNYRYRVVMIKDQHELDMRGRCSAGQKVLASLIIRLALSETFCLNCGILALDEPTTNLDRENIESLALALVEIIKNRQKQRNFQLVVITHDEDFVELLGRSDYVDEYFRMSKNEFGRSRLTKTSVQDLHHGR